MGEGLLRSLAGDRFESLSAGSIPAGFVHPIAIQVMTECDIDVGTHKSKNIRTFLPPDGTSPDVIVSVCDSADRLCPFFPGDVKRLRWPFADPACVEDKAAQLDLARRVRDELRARIVNAIEAGEFD